MSERSEKKIRILKDVMSLVACFAIALIAAIGIRLFVFELVRVDGDSMKPTLYDGQTLFVEKISLYTGNIQRGDIVIVHYPGRTGAYVKRVVGLAGDNTLEQVMNWDTEQTIVPEGCCYVMGDNRNDSMDSRSIGPIPEDDLIGKALFVIWPIGAIHSLG